MQKTKPFQMKHVLTVSLAHMLHDTYSSFLAPILPLLITKLNLSLSLAGFLSVISRAPSLLNPLLGILAESVSLRFFIILTPSVTAIAMSLLGIAPNYIILALLLLIMGVSATLFHIPTPVIIRQVSGDRVGKGMSFYMVGGELARSIGPVVILAAVSWWGLEGTYRLIPFGLLASAVLYARLKHIKIPVQSADKKKKSSYKKTLRHFLPFFIMIAGIMFFRSLMRASLTTFLPTYLNLSKGQTLWMGGLSLALLQLAGAAGTFFCGTISDKIGRRLTLFIVCLLSPLLMWAFLFSSGMFAMVVLALLGVSLTATTPVLLAMVQELKSDRPAFNNSIFMTINFLIGAGATLLVGVFGDTTGLVNTFRISAFLAFGSLFFVFKMKNTRT